MTNTPAQLPDPVTGRLRVGDCVVDVDRREVDRGDGTPPLRITVKALQVLIALAAHPDKVVSRDNLLEVVWAGTMPTDDVITQAVTALRKALGDDREAPAYIETIPKSGYRLLATTEWLPDVPPGNGEVAHSDAGASVPTAPARLSRAWLLGALVAACALAVAGWWWLGRDTVVAPVPASESATTNGELPYILLTSRPGSESQPALSPDGSLVAYAMPPGAVDGAPALFLQSTQPTPPRQLTSPPDGYSDHLPRWSPDGRQLMFARIDAVGTCDLLLMPSSGGVARTVGSCDRIAGRYDWLPDGSGVIAGLEAEPDGKWAPLAILRLATGEWEPMRYAIGEGDIDSDPHYSPDGTKLVFRRNISHADLWMMPATGGTPVRLTQLRGNIGGWDWTAESDALLLSGTSQLYRHDLATGRTRPLGRFNATGLDIAADRNAMVFVLDDAPSGMFRYALPANAGNAPEALFVSTGDDLLPSPSPDGNWLAFHSDRSREPRLWLGDLRQPDRLRMIDGLRPLSRHPPQWSDDSGRLLVIGDADDGKADAGPKLFEVDVASGRMHVIELDGLASFAQYLPGDRMLAVVDSGAGRQTLQILQGGGSPWRVAAQLADVGEARFDHASGAVHFVRTTGPGLWRTDLDLQAPEPVDPGFPLAHWLRRWTVLDGHPFTLRPSPECLARWEWLGEAAASAPSPGCLDLTRRGMPTQAPVVSRDGLWLYATMVTGSENSDIGFLDLDALAKGDVATH